MKTIFIFFLACFALSFDVFALQQETKTSLSEPEKEQAIKKACELLNRFYVFPEAATAMENHIIEKLKEGAFKDCNTRKDFARELTIAFRSVCHDKHLGLYLGPNPDKQNPGDRNLQRAIRKLDREKLNHGLVKVEILDENIGYIKLRSVMYSEEAMESLAAAMQLLSNTYSIIFDLRNNRGGDPAYMAWLFSYFFDEPTHINSIYWRRRDHTDDFWTHKDVPGKKMTDVPLFVLIGEKTFSGAEEFAYDLQAMDRATIVGNTSAGGANPASSWVVYENIRISIPFGRSINPVTGSNWEATGVIPDITCANEKALDVAIEKAKVTASKFYTARKNRLISNFKDCYENLEKAENLFVKNKNKEAEILTISTIETTQENEVMNQASCNQLGYDYLDQGKTLMAIAIFKSNVKLHPESADVYDSLGEAYLENGDKGLAKSNYLLALEIDPKYPTALRALEEIDKMD